MGVIVSKEIDSAFLCSPIVIIPDEELLDPATKLEFLTSLLSRINTEKAPEAHVLLMSTLAHSKLLYGDLEGTQNDMELALKVLDDLDGVDPSVNAAYYSVAADYYKVR